MHEAVIRDSENRPNQPFSLSSAVFKRLEWTFLTGFLLAAGNYINLPQTIFNQTFSLHI
jgi:hypothetical protein